MKISDLPAKFNVPFANSAGGGYVRTIPEASQVGIQNGAASLTTGFPPLNWLPVGAGGVPPFGQDMNGILRQITQWSRWQGAGGLSIYDSEFSTAIGGYPRGCMLSSATTPGVVWVSLVDDNIVDPDAGASANWSAIPTALLLQSGAYNYTVAGGSANALTASLTPAPASLVDGFPINIRITANNTGAASLNLNGLGVASIVATDGTALTGDELKTGVIIPMVYRSSQWRMGVPTAATDTDVYAGTSNSKYLTPSTLLTAKPTFFTLRRSSTSLPNNTVTLVSFLDAEQQLNDSTLTSNTFTVGANDAGMWQISIGGQLNPASSDLLLLLTNSGNTATYAGAYTPSVSNPTASTSTLLRFAAGDTLSVRMRQASGGTLSLPTADLRNFFTAVRLGA